MPLTAIVRPSGRAARSAAYVGSTDALAAAAAVNRTTAANIDFMGGRSFCCLEVVELYRQSTQTYLRVRPVEMRGLYSPGLQSPIGRKKRLRRSFKSF